MALYVDGVRVARRTDTTQGEAYLGYWRVGGDNLDGWPSQPSSSNFAGSVDEVAIYPTALDQDADHRPVPGERADLGHPARSGRRVTALRSTPTSPTCTGAWARPAAPRPPDSGRSLNEGTYRNGVTLGQPASSPVTRLPGSTAATQFVSS